MKKKEANKNRKHSVWEKITALAAVLLFVAVLLLKPPKGAVSSGLMKELSDLSFSRTIPAEEYHFLESLAHKNGSADEEGNVQQFIESVHAAFYLGSQLELCEPFDYTAFQYQVNAENQDRAIKKLNGQVYYGPDSFTEESYFEYIYSRLHSDIVTWLLDHRDGAMVRSAKAFYNDHIEAFTAITSVTYEITEDGVTETKTLQDSMFKTMGQSDPALMEFLSSAEDGQEDELPDGTGRTVKRLSIETQVQPFAENERLAAEIWLFHEGLDELIQAIVQNASFVF